jgi:hypothetical protein
MHVRVIDMFVDPDDDSLGEPNLRMVCDHDTGDVIRRLSNHELSAFYAEHPAWVEYIALLYEVQELVDDDR